MDVEGGSAAPRLAKESAWPLAFLSQCVVSPLSTSASVEWALVFVARRPSLNVCHVCVHMRARAQSLDTEWARSRTHLRVPLQSMKSSKAPPASAAPSWVSISSVPRPAAQPAAAHWPWRASAGALGISVGVKPHVMDKNKHGNVGWTLAL